MIEKIYNHLANSCNPETTYVHMKGDTIDITSSDNGDAMLMLIVVSEILCMYFDKKTKGIHLSTDIDFTNKTNSITIKII